MLISEREFKQFLTVNRDLSPKTIETYIYRYRIFCTWLIENDTEFSKDSVDKFIYEKRMKFSNSTVNTYRNTLVHIDNCLKRKDLPHGFTDDTPHLRKTPKEVETITKKDLEKLCSTRHLYANRNGVSCNNLDDKYRALTLFFAMTGCRFDEAASLTIDRLNIAHGKARIIKTKNGESRSVFFGNHGELAELLTELTEDRNEDEYVFTGSTNSKVLSTVYNPDLKRRAKEAGIIKWKTIHPHVLRHTFATEMLKSHVDITVVAKMLGHKDIRETYETYIHILDDTLQREIKKHPLLERYVDEKEFLEDVKIMLKLKFGDNPKFNCATEENNGYFKFEVKYKPKYPNVQTQ